MHACVMWVCIYMLPPKGPNIICVCVCVSLPLLLLLLLLHPLYSFHLTDFNSMGEYKGQIFRGPCCLCAGEAKDDDQWTILEGGGGDEDSVVSNNSSYSTDIADDASSSSTASSSSLHHTEPLYDLSELMAHLPIKRGLSKFYQGKSQSFTSLSRARSIEDLAKKETPYKRKMKACKSHGGGLDTYKSLSLIKPTISKKVSSRVPFSSSFLSRRGSFLNSCRPPLVRVPKDLRP